MSRDPRITFGMIVLNGEPYLPYNLRALYPFAHQIIAVEGAAPGAASIASPDGHSTDGTLDTLHKFKAVEDPDDKLIVVTAGDEGHPDGFWPGEKHEMSRAYAKRATGDYIWQVDVDEFYRPEDMHVVLRMLQQDPSIAAMSFRQITFWGGFDYLTDGWYLRKGAGTYHRLFRWGAGHQYVTHRPPTVQDANGRNLRHVDWVHGDSLTEEGVKLYHYSLVLPKQVIQKCAYYEEAVWTERSEALEWAKDVFFELRDPYHVHNVYDYPSWLERFRGSHPPQIQALQADLQTGILDIEVRSTEDIEALLRSPMYRFGRAALRISEPVARHVRPWRQRLLRLRRNLRDAVAEL